MKNKKLTQNQPKLGKAQSKIAVNYQKTWFFASPGTHKSFTTTTTTTNNVI